MKRVLITNRCQTPRTAFSDVLIYRILIVFRQKFLSLWFGFRKEIISNQCWPITIFRPIKSFARKNFQSSAQLKCYFLCVATKQNWTYFLLTSMLLSHFSKSICKNFIQYCSQFDKISFEETLQVFFKTLTVITFLLFANLMKFFWLDDPVW